MTEALARPILLTEQDGCAIITLNRPEKMNCLTKAVMDELAEILAQLRIRAEHEVLILTGAGGVFSAGADLGEVRTLDSKTAYAYSRRGQEILATIGRTAPVTIAAIEGYCLGGGLDVALSCDLRYASPRSTFQHPGTSRGLITGWGGTQRLPRLTGLDAARRMLITGEQIEARQALDLGLINGIQDNPLGYACHLAERISKQFDGEQLKRIKLCLEKALTHAYRVGNTF